MADIVERLKARAEQEYEMLGDIHLPLLEAADEIERLRAALREIAEMIPHAMPDYTHQVWKTARAALGGGDE